MSETSAMFVHQMNRNELMPWWFVQVQPNSEEPLMTEKKVMDNTGFSLTLGGRNGMDSALPPSSPSSSSCQVYGSPRKPRVGLNTISSTGLLRLSFCPSRVYQLFLRRDDVDLNMTDISKMAV
jgi:hypothetical protein